MSSIKHSNDKIQTNITTILKDHLPNAHISNHHGIYTVSLKERYLLLWSLVTSKTQTNTLKKSKRNFQKPLLKFFSTYTSIYEGNSYMYQFSTNS